MIERILTPEFWWCWGLWCVGAAAAGPLAGALRRAAARRKNLRLTAKGLLARAEAKRTAVSAGVPGTDDPAGVRTAGTGGVAHGIPRSGRLASRRPHRRVPRKRWLSFALLWLLAAVVFFGIGTSVWVLMRDDPALTAFEMQTFGVPAESPSQGLVEYVKGFFEPDLLWCFALPAGLGFVWMLSPWGIRGFLGVLAAVFIVVGAVGIDASAEQPVRYTAGVARDGQEVLLISIAADDSAGSLQSRSEGRTNGTFSGYWRIQLQGYRLPWCLALFLWPPWVVTSFVLEPGTIASVASDSYAYEIVPDGTRVPIRSPVSREFAADIQSLLLLTGAAMPFSLRSDFSRVPGYGRWGIALSHGDFVMFSY